MGKAVAAPDLEPIREILRDEETGFIFPRGDVASLARVLLKAARQEDLRKQMGEAARRVVAEEYTWTHQAQLIVDMARKHLSARGGSEARHQKAFTHSM